MSNKVNAATMMMASTLIASIVTTLSGLSLPTTYTMYQVALAQKSLSNSTMLTYQNPDIGLSMQYPSNWIKQQGNLIRNTIVAFELKQHQFRSSLDFVNMTLAEVDLRVYPAPQNMTSATFKFGDIILQNQALINHYQNSTTKLGGLPAIKIVSYLFGEFTEKTMQVWAFVPSRHIIVELVYIVQPPQYSLYLPAVLQMINSVKIAK